MCVYNVHVSVCVFIVYVYLLCVCMHVNTCNFVELILFFHSVISTNDTEVLEPSLEKKPQLYLLPFPKMNSKWIMILNVKVKL